MVSSIVPKNEQKKFDLRGIIVLLGRMFSFFSSFFGRIEDAINYFRDFRTFKNVIANPYTTYVFMNINFVSYKGGEILGGILILFKTRKKITKKYLMNSPFNWPW